jgi:hypothetical protein
MCLLSGISESDMLFEADLKFHAEEAKHEFIDLREMLRLILFLTLGLVGIGFLVGVLSVLDLHHASDVSLPTVMSYADSELLLLS